MQVRLVEFSPDEKCIISYSSREPSNPNEKAGLLLNVYDCATGQRLRSFEGSIDDYAVGSAATSDGSLKWPIFKWAANTCAPLPPASSSPAPLLAQLHTWGATKRLTCFYDRIGTPKRPRKPLHHIGKLTLLRSRNKPMRQSSYN